MDETKERIGNTSRLKGLRWAFGQTTKPFIDEYLLIYLLKCMTKAPNWKLSVASKSKSRRQKKSVGVTSRHNHNFLRSTWYIIDGGTKTKVPFRRVLIV